MSDLVIPQVRTGCFGWIWMEKWRMQTTHSGWWLQPL